MGAEHKEYKTTSTQQKYSGKGVYILFDGSMPVYVGKGNIKQRVSGAKRSRKRGQLWDRFSWYGLKDANMMHDIEVLVLRMLPPYLRALTTNKGNFVRATRVSQPDKISEYITSKASKEALSACSSRWADSGRLPSQETFRASRAGGGVQR